MEVNQSNQPQDDKVNSLVRKIADEFRALFAEVRSQPVLPEECGTPQEANPVPGGTAAPPHTAVCMAVTEKLQQQGETLNMLLDKTVKIETSVHDFTYKDEINNRLHDELQKYKNGLRKEFITPLLKGITREYDRVVRQYKYYSAEAQTGEQSELAVNLLKQLQMTAFGLLDLLSDYDIEPFEPKAGEPFNAKEQKAMETVETNDAALNNTIAVCTACGFRDISSDRLMRQAEVNIYKQKQSQQTS